jgi:hypothetical protein
MPWTCVPRSAVALADFLTALPRAGFVHRVHDMARHHPTLVALLLCRHVPAQPPRRVVRSSAAGAAAGMGCGRRVVVYGERCYAMPMTTTSESRPGQGQLEEKSDVSASTSASASEASQADPQRQLPRAADGRGSGSGGGGGKGVMLLSDDSKADEEGKVGAGEREDEEDDRERGDSGVSIPAATDIDGSTAVPGLGMTVERRLLEGVANGSFPWYIFPSFTSKVSFL